MKYNEITMDMIANFFGEEEVMNHIDEMSGREIKRMIDSSDMEIVYQAIDAVDHWDRAIVPYAVQELCYYYGIDSAAYDTYDDIWDTIVKAHDAARNGMVRNLNGTYVYFNVAVEMMDDSIREKLAMELMGCSQQEFFDAYEVLHERKYGEEWELSKVNPVY